MICDLREIALQAAETEMKAKGLNPHRLAKMMEKDGILSYETCRGFFRKRGQGSVETINAICSYLNIYVRYLPLEGLLPAGTFGSPPVLKKCPKCKRRMRWKKFNIDTGLCADCEGGGK